MKRFDFIKTIQLILLAVATVAGLIVVIRDRTLAAQIAADGHIRLLAILLWAVLGVSFLFLFYDFNSWSALKRENLELDNAIYSDALTGVANRYSVDVYIGQFQNKPLPRDMGCVTVELCSLAGINEALGHNAGDNAIRDFAEIMTNASQGICFIGRNGGNKFVAIFRDCTERRLQDFQKNIAEGVAEQNRNHPEAQLRYRFGAAFHEDDTVQTVAQLVALSDHRAWKSGETAVSADG